MQFFYIDYMKDGKKERNIGFLRVGQDGINVGLRGVPAQCGDSCKVYVTNIYGETNLLGEISIKNGYGMEKFGWKQGTRFEDCMCVEVPLYGGRKGVCVLRDKGAGISVEAAWQKEDKQDKLNSTPLVSRGHKTETKEMIDGSKEIRAYSHNNTAGYELCDEIHEDKWQQLLALYPQVHICPEAQSILITPKDVVILTRQYHELASNSFVLHAYYNYRQLLLFKYGIRSNLGQNPSANKLENVPQYYIGVPGVYYEREQRIAQLFGFEGFENGEARMQHDADRKVYRGCFGYYMKHVEI